MVHAEGIRVVYRKRGGGILALDGVSLDVDPGQMLAVLGPSGSGKSTLLHVLGTLLTPDAGTVAIAGQVVSTLREAARRRVRRQRVGFLFQTFHLMPYLTAEENVRMALAAKGLPAEGASDWLARVGMAARADHLPNDLSVGERQRVALARALAGRPSLLLADEPTGSLDPAHGDVVIGHLAEAAREGAAVVIVTHDPALASRADRCMRLEPPDSAIDGGGSAGYGPTL